MSTHSEHSAGSAEARAPSVTRLPAFLTVEEAGVLLRLGRTTAYALAREWRRSEGKSGLPVVCFGRQLRVPLRMSEDLAGGPLEVPLGSSAEGDGPCSEPPVEAGETGGGRDEIVVPDATPSAIPPTTSRPSPTTGRVQTTKSLPPVGGQPSLFGEAS